MKASSIPKLDRTMELADGRTLAWSEWGDLGGRPVVLLLGTPGSRLCCPDVDATEAAQRPADHDRSTRLRALRPPTRPHDR